MKRKRGGRGTEDGKARTIVIVYDHTILRIAPETIKLDCTRVGISRTGLFCEIRKYTEWYHMVQIFNLCDCYLVCLSKLV